MMIQKICLILSLIIVLIFHGNNYVYAENPREYGKLPDSLELKDDNIDKIIHNLPGTLKAMALERYKNLRNNLNKLGVLLKKNH